MDLDEIFEDFWMNKKSGWRVYVKSDASCTTSSYAR